MSEYIKREDAIATVRRLFDMRHGIAKEYVELYADMIEDLEPIEIVHCKDCKFYAYNKALTAKDKCKWITTEAPNEDDFCSRAERKESDEE